MSNSYFQFKQFRVNQDKCAMKVTTDACVLGAWAPTPSGVKRALDIGAGTGLLSMMLAQRTPGLIIDAVEIDNPAAGQARANVEDGPWGDRINVLEADIRNYGAPYKYDLIISNPPFFNNSLLGPIDSGNLARHTLSLSYSGLLKAIAMNLDDAGCASVLLPCPEYFQFYELMRAAGMYERCKLQIKHTINSEAKRVVTVFGKTRLENVAVDELIIKDEGVHYTSLFKALLAPFYLYL